MTSSTPGSARWLFGPLPDLLLGCGLGYAAVFVVLCFAAPRVEAVLPAGLFPLLLLVTGTPHYGATLLRVYERREDRRAYTLFAVWITLAMVALFVAAVHSAWLGSWLLTLMLTWSPWHYTGQNYGISLMFLRRRGVAIAPGTKRLIYASFMLSFLLTVLAVHGEAPRGEYAPSPYQSTEYRFIPLGIPDAVRVPGFAVLSLAYLATLLGAGTRLLRVASLRDLAPAAALAGTQALWFTVPVLARAWNVLDGVDPLSMEHAAYAFLWVAVGHSVQYLWICTYYARRSERDLNRLGYLAKALCAGAAVWTVPALLFAPGLAGRVPFDSGLEVLVAAVVNLHHFVLDGAIWKLRDGRIARILIRSGEEPGVVGAGPGAFAPRWSAAPLVWAVGAACALVIATGALEWEFGLRRAAELRDVERVGRATQRLAWLGRESPEAWSVLGVLRAEAGDREQAIRDAERSLALYPTARGWNALGQVYVAVGEPERAIPCFRNALAHAPGMPEAANNLAWLRATHPDPRVRDSAEAVALAEEAARATGYAEPTVLDTLAAAYASASRFGEARSVAARARALSIASDDADLAVEIEARRQLYAAGRSYRDGVPSGDGVPTATSGDEVAGGSGSKASHAIDASPY